MESLESSKMGKKKSKLVIWAREKYPRKHFKLRVFTELSVILLLMLIGLWSIAEANGSWWAVMLFGSMIKEPLMYHVTNVMIVILFAVAIADITLMAMSKPRKRKEEYEKN